MSRVEVGAIGEYLERWRAVEAREAAERRDTSLAIRWRQHLPELWKEIEPLLEAHSTGEKNGG